MADTTIETVPIAGGASVVAVRDPRLYNDYVHAGLAWLPTGDAAREWIDRGVAELAVGVEDLRNVPLFGRLPTGDARVWSAADFLAVS